MKTHAYLISSLALMIFGEILTIYSEVYASKLPGHPIDTPMMFLKPIVLMSIAGVSLIFAHWLGYQGSGNIWVVTVASLTLPLYWSPLSFM
jgi:phosphatidylglycerophosphate synthase